MNAKPSPTAPIGAFDSGVGGLSVLRAMQAHLPGEDFLYVGDQANVPYGPRGLDEVRRLSEGIVRFLIGQGAKLIAIPCNTASAAALYSLRAQHPEMPFVGMEPALKPAAETTETGVVGVLATPTTFEGELYASVVERFGQGVTILQATCLGLVAEIEAGRAHGVEARRILKTALEPMIAQGVDTIVLGCTHYPFAFDTIRDLLGDKVRFIDPAPAIARRIASLLDASSQRNPRTSGGDTHYFTTGNPNDMQTRVRELLAIEAKVDGLTWRDGEVVST